MALLSLLAAGSLAFAGQAAQAIQEAPVLSLPSEPLTALVPPSALQAQALPKAVDVAAVGAVPVAQALGAELHAVPAGGLEAHEALDRRFENAHGGAQALEASAVPGAEGVAIAALQPYTPHVQEAQPQPPAPMKTVAAKTWASTMRDRIALYSLALLSTINPARALQPAVAEPNASFLVQKVYGYKDDPAFVIPMSGAIADTADYLRGMKQKGEKLSTRDVKEMTNYIARVRQDIAISKGASDWYNYGNPIPEASVELDQMAMTGERPSPETWASGTTVDFLSDDPSDRHYAFFAQAQTRLRDHAGDDFPTQITVDGRSYPYSHVRPWPNENLALIHPDFGEMAPMRKHAFEIIAQAYNDPKIGEARFMDRLAAAYQLLVHATPWVRGSPSIIEAYFDALLRAKYGKTLPPKTGEPFWDAALRDPRAGQYTGRDFLKNFGGS